VLRAAHAGFVDRRAQAARHRRAAGPRPPRRERARSAPVDLLDDLNPHPPRSMSGTPWPGEDVGGSRSRRPRERSLSRRLESPENAPGHPLARSSRHAAPARSAPEAGGEPHRVGARLISSLRGWSPPDQREAVESRTARRSSRRGESATATRSRLLLHRALEGSRSGGAGADASHCHAARRSAARRAARGESPRSSPRIPVLGELSLESRASGSTLDPAHRASPRRTNARSPSSGSRAATRWPRPAMPCTRFIRHPRGDRHATDARRGPRRSAHANTAPGSVWPSEAGEPATVDPTASTPAGGVRLGRGEARERRDSRSASGRTRDREAPGDGPRRRRTSPGSRSSRARTCVHRALAALTASVGA